MTNDELRAILEKRRDEWKDKVETLGGKMAALSDERVLAYAHLSELEFALEQLGPATQVAPPPAPRKERAARRDIPALVLAAIKARTAISPLRHDEVIQYLCDTLNTRKSSIEKAIAKLVKRKQIPPSSEGSTLYFVPLEAVVTDPLPLSPSTTTAARWRSD